MSMKCSLAYLIVFSLLFSIKGELTLEEISNLCRNALLNCEMCLNAHQDCTWCADDVSAGVQRCRTRRENQKDCKKDLIVDTSSTVIPIVNREFENVENVNPDSNIVYDQIRPQGLKVQLREDAPVTIDLTVKKLLDYPLDLYYLMDLSLSMEDDLNQIKSIADNLVNDINNISSNAHLGFGSFVDKEVSPFTVSNNLLQSICQEEIGKGCQPTFDFHHQLSLTFNSSLFRNVVNRTTISANIDEPEGSFDALMQVVVCQDIINWRKNSLKVVLITTDATPHMAWDGKLAGILEHNDMKCHLVSDGDTGILLNPENRNMDYPSIGQLQEVLRRNQIQAIFAVTDQVFNVFKDLPNIMTNSIVARLSSDSSNIQSLISESYDAIRSKFELIRPEVPSNIELSYRVKCPNATSWINDSLFCNNVFVNDEVQYQFTLTSKNCPSVQGHQDNITIISQNIPDVVNIIIGYECECNCVPVVNSSQCNFLGNLDCGICLCDPGRSGTFCQCQVNETSSELQEKCQSFGVDEVQQEMCSSRGYCECGSCVCQTNYYGNLCECSVIGCPQSDGLVCGGPEKGNCENCNGSQACVCNSANGWYIDSETSTCSCNEGVYCKSSATDDVVCGGNGICECDKCKCDDEFFWSGTLCDNCVHPNCTTLQPTCSGEFKDCAICTYTNQVNVECNSVCGDKGISTFISKSNITCDKCQGSTESDVCAECSEYNLIKLPLINCMVNREDECNVTFQIGWLNSVEQYFVRVLERNVERDCPSGANLLIIILPVVGGIVLGGIIGLLVWKVAKTNYDRRNYEKFLAESELNRKWTNNKNPVYKETVVKTINPMYIPNEEDDVKDSDSPFDSRLHNLGTGFS